MRKKLLLIIVLFIHIYSFSQPSLKFERYSKEKGLPTNYVLEICQDNKGFMWFALRGGCCRFDGFQFKTFPVRTTNGRKPLISWVSHIIMDKDNRLWFVEMGHYGLLLFDDDNEEFVPYQDTLNLHGPDNSIQFNSLFCDKNKELWFAYKNNGLMKYNPGTGRAEHFHQKSNDSSTISQVGTNVIIEDTNSNSLWMGKTNGLSHFDKKNQTFQDISIQIQNKEAQQDVSIICMYIDSKNTLWIGTERNGLFQYDKSANKLIAFKHNETDLTINSNNTIYSITEDEKKQLWIGTLNGACVLNNDRTNYQKYYNDEQDFESLSSNLIRKIYIDNANTLWFGTAEGVSKLKAHQFKSFRYSNQHNSLSNNKVIFLTENQHNTIWIATPKGIDVYDRSKNEFTFVAGITNDKNGLYGAPVCLEELANKGMWAGTYNGGLSFVDYETLKVVHFMNPLKKQYELLGNFISSLRIENNQYLWIGTMGKGLFRYDLEAKNIMKYQHNDQGESSVPSNNIHCMYQDRDSALWVGTDKGVAIYEGGAQGTFRKVFNSKTSEDDFYVHEIIKLKINNCLWFGTSSGLIQFYPSTEKYVVYKKEHGLVDKNILGILDDKRGNIWLSTPNGLIKARYDYPEYDTITNFKVYNKSDGLQGDEFLTGSCCQLSDGAMAFGGYNGFSLFHPDSIRDDPSPPRLEITELWISNKPVKVGDSVNGQIILEKSILNTGKITLNYKNNNFSVKLIALQFNQPENNTYSYKLEGFDQNWKTISAHERIAHYKHIPEGDYVFMFKASNCDGIWSEGAEELHIVVLPPWRRTWWAKIFITVLILTVIITLYQAILHSNKKRKMLLEEKINEQTKLLQKKLTNNIITHPDEVTTTAIDKNFIKKAVHIIEEHLLNPDFNNNMFISLCGLSKPTVYKKIKNITNQSVSDFIRSVRLKKAAELLLKEDKTISEISFMVGFKDRRVFTRYFSKMFGMTPSQYINEFRKQIPGDK